MTSRLTYGEQLRHPNWQRLRLERLKAADWKCEACGDTETTLHVHHKRYLKGHMAWEYPAENFAVLCDPCHSEAHEQQETMRALLALLPLQKLAEVISLLAGYYGGDLDPIDQAAFGGRDPHAANVGFAARWLVLAKLGTSEVAELGSALQDDAFVAYVRAELKRINDEVQADVARHLQSKRLPGEGAA